MKLERNQGANYFVGVLWAMLLVMLFMPDRVVLAYSGPVIKVQGGSNLVVSTITQLDSTHFRVTSSASMHDRYDSVGGNAQFVNSNSIYSEMDPTAAPCTNVSTGGSNRAAGSCIVSIEQQFLVKDAFGVITNLVPSSIIQKDSVQVTFSYYLTGATCWCQVSAFNITTISEYTLPAALLTGTHSQLSLQAYGVALVPGYSNMNNNEIVAFGTSVGWPAATLTIPAETCTFSIDNSVLSVSATVAKPEVKNILFKSSCHDSSEYNLWFEPTRNSPGNNTEQCMVKDGDCTITLPYTTGNKLSLTSSTGDITLPLIVSALASGPIDGAIILNVTVP